MKRSERDTADEFEQDVDPHVHQIRTRYVNTYLIESPQGLLVVDVAPGGWQYVLGYIRETLQREPDDVDLVVCTHNDPDHVGGVFKLAQLCDAAVGMPYTMSSRLGRFKSLPVSATFRILTSLREALRFRAWRMYANPVRSRRAREHPTHVPDIEGDRDQWQPEQHKLMHGQRLPGFEDWQVVHTPGHSWDSCCYFHAPTRSLISGDTLLGSSTRGKLVRPAVYSSARHLERSLTRLQKLDPGAVYPGHGSLFKGERLLAHL